MNVLFLKLHLLVQDVLQREDGQDLMEYGLLVALISCVAVAASNGLASAFNDAFVRVSNTLA